MKPLKLEYFSQARVLMLIAAQKHPVLVERCANYNNQTQWPEIVGEIAAYCNVAMDGNYYEHELEALYVILESKLSNMPILLAKDPLIAEEDMDFSKYEHKLIGKE